jgi:transposase
MKMFNRLYHPSEINRAIKAYIDLKSFRKAEKATSMPKSTIHRFFVKFNKQGIVKGTKRNKRKVQKRKLGKMDFVLEMLARRPTITLDQVRCAFPIDSRPCLSTIHRIIKSLGYKRRRIRKKYIYCSEQALKEKVQDFGIQVKNIDIASVISLDETGFISHTPGEYGYFDGPAPAKVEYGTKREKVSCAMAVTTRGVLRYAVQDKAFNKNAFITFFKSIMDAKPINCTYVLMDNIAFHHSKEIAEIATMYGVHILFTPPYSPRFNPIEMVFSLLKREYRTQRYDGTQFRCAVETSLRTIRDRYTSFDAQFAKSLIKELQHEGSTVF